MSLTKPRQIDAFTSRTLRKTDELLAFSDSPLRTYFIRDVINFPSDRIQAIFGQFTDDPDYMGVAVTYPFKMTPELHKRVMDSGEFRAIILAVKEIKSWGSYIVEAIFFENKTGIVAEVKYLPRGWVAEDRPELVPEHFAANDWTRFFTYGMRPRTHAHQKP
jgi:hypothetical protein